MAEGADDLLRACSGDLCEKPIFKLFSAALGEAREKPLRSAVQLINTRVNHAIRYRSDSAQYRVLDYWATFRETVRNGRGDCLDYATVKLWMLRALGIPFSSLHVVIIRAPELKKKDHAVLLLRLGDEQLVPGQPV
jgi:predicted transglutaminase-like cysteine proteinase